MGHGDHGLVSDQAQVRPLAFRAPSTFPSSFRSHNRAPAATPVFFLGQCNKFNFLDVRKAKGSVVFGLHNVQADKSGLLFGLRAGTVSVTGPARRAILPEPYP